ncbi:ribosome maturation factor RimM [Duganella callida]|uniref:Ribosome maturation factor RimM n=1 Tax=Duganella callida TaxID=2561932 RepID=A0A4Y9S5J4_9BURK|nr:ribosome maturation factor RimM [Duganella callida]TFW16461.1 ribosome maturation factor RimM [Duganella callida]
MTEKNASGVKIPEDLVQVGFIAGAYGIAGWVRIRPFSEEADALRKVKTWWLDKPALRDVDVQQVKLHSGDVVARLVGVADRDLAESLKGAGVFIPQSRFPALAEDEFYWTDLIGLEVENLQGEHLGKVTDMMSNGPQSILRITPAPAPDADPDVAAQERLIPFVDAFINKVDKEAGKIIVDWGLDY